MRLRLEEIEKINENVREFLNVKHPKEDVIVRIGRGSFFGFWKWSEENQLHNRFNTDMLRQSIDVVSYARALTLVPINEHLIR